MPLVKVEVTEAPVIFKTDDCMPPVNEEVAAEVLRIEPPVMVRPPDEERPAVCVFCRIVEVPEPATVKLLFAAKAEAISPPLKVEVPVSPKEAA